jgi:hypothetical protein
VVEFVVVVVVIGRKHGTSSSASIYLRCCCCWKLELDLFAERPTDVDFKSTVELDGRRTPARLRVHPEL